MLAGSEGVGGVVQRGSPPLRGFYHDDSENVRNGATASAPGPLKAAAAAAAAGNHELFGDEDDEDMASASSAPSAPEPRRNARQTLNAVFAKHRFDKDVLDLRSTGNHYFLPHARVCFVSSGQTVICGVEPQDGAYSGSRWEFSIELPDSFPFHSPHISALSPLFHPNVDAHTGAVDLRLLHEWSPVLTLRFVVLGLVLLFVEPNMERPVNAEAAHLLATDLAAFIDKVQLCKHMLAARRMAHEDPFAAAAVRAKRPAVHDGAANVGLAKRRFIFSAAQSQPEQQHHNHSNSQHLLPLQAQLPQHHQHERVLCNEAGAQRILVQKLTTCSLSGASNKRRKTTTT
jgi:ubiquitin-protein ligase